jgi:DNA polymerase-3 subunit epsilon
MAILLGLDLETTGLDPDTDDIIEIGFVVWNAVKHTPVCSYSALTKGAVPIPETIASLTGIDDANRHHGGVELGTAINALAHWANRADYFVAHNAAFEQSFLNNRLALGVSIPWIDTMTDLPYPSTKGKGSLSEICMNHGIFNPMPHRALPDAFAMMQLLAKYPFDEVERTAKIPSIKIMAVSSFDQKDVVKAQGFYWNPGTEQMPDKCWWKSIKENRLDEEVGIAQQHGYSIRILT